MFAKVQQTEGLERDLSSGVLVSTPDEFQRYMEQRNRRLQELRKDNELQEMKTRVARLEELVERLLSSHINK